MRADDVYGQRKDRHQRILMMNETELHSEYLWTSALTFNTSMTKKEINEKSIKAGNAPEASTILGDKAGATHRWVIGNEAGEVLPRFLMQKFIVIEVIFLPLSAEPHFACTGTLTDIPPPHHVCCAVRRAYHSQTYRLHTTYAAQSGKVYGRETDIVTSDAERDRLFAMVREAQLRGIQPLALKEDKPKGSKKRAPASMNAAGSKRTAPPRTTGADAGGNGESDGELCD